MNSLAVYFGSLIILALTILLADQYYPFLRDLPPGTVQQVSRERRSYSLARVQMAYWTVIVASSIIYVLWKTKADGMPPTIDSNILALIGVSGATGIAAAVPDVSKDKQSETTTAAFNGTATAIGALDAQLRVTFKGSTGGKVANLAMAGKLLADRAKKIEELSMQENSSRRSRGDIATGGFWSDLVSDPNGNSLHRLQLILFTAIFGVYFIAHVARAGDIASIISAQMVALMGISGSVYVGYKIPGQS